MPKAQNTATAPAGAKRKLTRAEKKEIAALIQKAKGDGKPHTAQQTKGDPEAMEIVVHHYDSYIASLSMRKLRDERGNSYYGIDEDIRDRLRSKLMRAVLSFKA